MSTAPTSKRFPTTNQAKACYMYYNSWHQCKYDKGDDDEQCARLKHWSNAMCPIEWVRLLMRARPSRCPRVRHCARPEATTER
jgi:cytochrome c oxidase subunit 6b